MPLSPLNQSTLSNIRLITSDVDGTLTQNGKFTSDFISTLLDLQSAGIKVLLITGRSAGWVSALVNYLPIEGAIASSPLPHNLSPNYRNQSTIGTTKRLRHFVIWYKLTETIIKALQSNAFIIVSV